MTRIILYILAVFWLVGCGQEEPEQIHLPEKTAQWINPLYYNNEFEHELNFPLWFDDSLIKAHRIYKITRRIFGHEEDTLAYKDGGQAIPKEKTEFYFDPNGLVDQIVIYSYFDDREIARANFIYEGNMAASGYRSVRFLPFMTLNKKPHEDQFTTEIIPDQTRQYCFMKRGSKASKFECFADAEKGNNLIVIPKAKYWGPLSVDSIVHPEADDWIVHGSMRKPYKRYHVENIVNETAIYRYSYYSSGVLKQRTQKTYPFERRRSYLYNAKNQWSAYIDSTFSENQFLTLTRHDIRFDQYGRPMEIIHRKFNGEVVGYTYRETINYRAKQQYD